MSPSLMSLSRYHHHHHQRDVPVGSLTLFIVAPIPGTSLSLCLVTGVKPGSVQPLPSRVPVPQGGGVLRQPAVTVNTLSRVQ